MFHTAYKNYQKNLTLLSKKGNINEETFNHVKSDDQANVRQTSNIYNGVCELLICDEAHKLKNADSGLSSSLTTLPAKKRILLSGTPMQNELSEFYNMVNFCNPNVLGSAVEFRKKYERPILLSHEPDASQRDIAKAKELQTQLSTIVNEFILKRGNILNAKHLPPKLVQFVCCKLTDLQEKMTDVLLNSKEMRAIRDGKQSNTLNCIRQLINICSHPQLIMDNYNERIKNNDKVDEDLLKLVELIKIESNNSDKITAVKSSSTNLNTKSKGYALSSKNMMSSTYIDPDLSGKLLVLHRLMGMMRALKQNERIVIVSNFTSTLDLIEQVCNQEMWPVLRLDGTTGGTKRTALVDKFNDKNSGAFAFLLSSKAGGCGINLIGGNRLVLFDPDWNPASDKQAAGRIWREGQQKRCYIYRFMSTGTIEEKIIQRQLSKEGLQNIVDDTEQVNRISSSELKRLFIYRGDKTRSDTHDTLKCKRCKSVAKNCNALHNTLASDQINICSQFIKDFTNGIYLKSININPDYHNTLNIEISSDENPIIEINTLHSFHILDSIHNDLLIGKYSSLQVFSKKLRNAIMSIDRDPYEQNEKIVSHDDTSGEDTSALKISFKPLDIFNTFLSKWSSIVNQLSIKKSMKNVSDFHENDDDEDDTDEVVEQEGCPDETDFNRWSHHSSVNTCDDEVLKKAMSDDTTVNYDLLQIRDETKRLELLQKKIADINESIDDTVIISDSDKIDTAVGNSNDNLNDNISKTNTKVRSKTENISLSKKRNREATDDSASKNESDSKSVNRKDNIDRTRQIEIVEHGIEDEIPRSIRGKPKESHDERNINTNDSKRDNVSTVEKKCSVKNARKIDSKNAVSPGTLDDYDDIVVMASSRSSRDTGDNVKKIVDVKKRIICSDDDDCSGSNKNRNSQNKLSSVDSTIVRKKKKSVTILDFQDDDSMIDCHSSILHDSMNIVEEKVEMEHCNDLENRLTLANQVNLDKIHYDEGHENRKNPPESKENISKGVVLDWKCSTCSYENSIRSGRDYCGLCNAPVPTSLRNLLPKDILTKRKSLAGKISKVILQDNSDRM